MNFREDTNEMKENDKNFDIRLSALEGVVAETLLVELFNAKKAEVFENVVFEKTRRYYIEDLTVRDYTLEHTTPYQLDILGYAIEEHSWGLLLCKTTDLLLTIFPNFKDKILLFQCPWTKAKMFALEEKTNFKPLKSGIYINCNHTALHSCWFLQDLLDFFGIEKSTVSFLIHRPSGAEPKKVRDYVEERFKRNFAEFIKLEFNKPNEYAEKVIRMIDKCLNPMLARISKSYTNLFLFDDNATLANYIKKIREQINSSLYFNDRAKKSLNKYLDFLVKYYKK